MNWLNRYFSAVVRVAGTNLPMRGILDLSGSGVTASDETLDDGTPVTRLTIAGGGSSTVTPLGSAPLVVVKDVSGTAIRHRTIKVTGNKSGEMDPAGFTGEIHIRPSPPGWFNPMDYGCFFDGINDDLPGLLAMFADMPAGNQAVVVHLPPGQGYCSDWLHIDRAIYWRGQGTGILDVLAPSKSGIRFACLKGVVFENVFTSALYPSGNGSSGAVMEHVALESVQCIVASPTGGNGRNLKCIDTSLDIRHPSTVYRKGDVVIKSGSAGSGAQTDYTNEGATRGGVKVMFRSSGGTTSATVGDPALFGTATVANIGSTVVDGGVTWTVESIPKDYINGHAYVVGERAFVPGDPSCYFECVVAGTSIAAGVKNYAFAGIGVTIPAPMAGQQYGDTFPDNPAAPTALQWTRHYAGVVTLGGGNKLRHCAISGFTGAAIVNTSNLDATAYPASGGTGDGAFFRFESNDIGMCGMGIRNHGVNASGGTTRDNNGVFLGSGRTNVDAAAYLNIGALKFGTGAAMVHDRAQGPNLHENNYLQFSAGAPYRNDDLGGGGNQSHWVSCRAEVAYPCLFAGVPLVEQCSPLPTSGAGIIFDGNNSRGYREMDQVASPTPLSLQLSGKGGQAIYTFCTPSLDGPNFWGLAYGNNQPVGCWGMQYGPQGVTNAYLLTSTACGTVNPGAGWLAFEDGFILGAPTTSAHVFRGHMHGWTSRRLRAGFRRVGDQFSDDTTTITVSAAGYKGLPWAASTAYSSTDYEPWAIPAYTIEPTANTGKTAGGEQVWQLTTAGVSGGTEPSWPASPTAGVTTQTDGTCVWTYLGATPAVEVDQRDAKARVHARCVSTSTSTATANQVLHDGGVLDGVDLALPSDSITTITDTITVHITGSANGGKIVIESTFVRNGAGAPALIGTNAADYTKVTGDASTVAHVISGNRISLQCSPATAVARTWRVARTQVVGVD